MTMEKRRNKEKSVRKELRKEYERERKRTVYEEKREIYVRE